MRSLLRELVSGDHGHGHGHGHGHDCGKPRELIGGVGTMSTAGLSNEQVIATTAEMVAARRFFALEDAQLASLA